MVTIRKGEKKDLAQLFELIQELALYEKAPDEVTNTIEKMEEDGFGDNPIFEFLVAEKADQLIGASIYYYRYSTWKGKRLYLEDLIVTEKVRGKGIGQNLFDKTIETAKSEKCTGMTWQVLDWNEPAINFYKLYGADLDGSWINCNLNF